MLKDFLKLNNKKTKDKILSLVDGYVDIKAYKHFDDGSKKLVYHDTGDNAVTTWMRQIILQLLTGYCFGDGHMLTVTENNSNDVSSVTKPNPAAHRSSFNLDGYCLNGEQFFYGWPQQGQQGNNKNLSLYPIDIDKDYMQNDGNNNIYALFPTKILLGTGREFSNWNEISSFKEDNSSFYNKMLNEYGDGSEQEAIKQLDGENDTVGIIDDPINVYSGTLNSENKLKKTITVNDPNEESDVYSIAELSSRKGVIGAIKTIYTGKDQTLLETVISENGRMLNPNIRGYGRPCFIYFNRVTQDKLNSKIGVWCNVTNDITLRKSNENGEYFNQITFRIVMPSQSSGSSSIGKYYPFNGYTFKQIGLFNDAWFNTDEKGSTDKTIMPCGTMLAIKNIQKFSKTADESVEFTWTLTI